MSDIELSRATLAISVSREIAQPAIAPLFRIDGGFLRLSAGVNQAELLNLDGKILLKLSRDHYTASSLASHASAFLRMTNEKFTTGVSGPVSDFANNQVNGFATRQTAGEIRFAVPSSLSGFTLALSDMRGKRYDMGTLHAGEYAVSKKLFSSGVLLMTISMKNNTVYSKQVVCVR